MRIYLDHNATTPLDPQVADRVVQAAVKRDRLLDVELIEAPEAGRSLEWRMAFAAAAPFRWP